MFYALRKKGTIDKFIGTESIPYDSGLDFTLDSDVPYITNNKQVLEVVLSGKEYDAFWYNNNVPCLNPSVSYEINEYEIVEVGVF